MPLEPFFSGNGLDRADLVRGNPEQLGELAARPDARRLRWANGLPDIDGNGRLQWDSGPADIFLGLNGNAPCFSAIEPGGKDLRAQFNTLAHLHWDDAPVFAAAASLASWHRRHTFCANCGQPSDLVRGGWSRRCPACAAEHFPRVDPVVIMLAEHEGRLLLGRQPQYPPNRYSALAGWFTREEVAAALSGTPDASFIPPPPFAIARSLLEHWLALDEARFPA